MANHKPCPFCGGEPTFTDTFAKTGKDEYGGKYRYHVECDHLVNNDCKMQVFICAATPEEAWKIWDRRA